MPERDIEDFWREDHLLGEIPVHDQAFLARMMAHQSPENHHGRSSESLFTPNAHRGPRDYLLARFYILVPDFRMTVAFEHDAKGQPIQGRIIGSSWPGMRHEEIGAGQAWFYPEEDRTAVLWEILPKGRYYRETEDPTTDDTLKGLWSGFESHLRERWNPARILTPSWEPMYETELWRRFLVQQGYTPAEPRAFVKDTGKHL